MSVAPKTQQAPEALTLAAKLWAVLMGLELVRSIAAGVRVYSDPASVLPEGTNVTAMTTMTALWGAVLAGVFALAVMGMVRVFLASMIKQTARRQRARIISVILLSYYIVRALWTFVPGTPLVEGAAALLCGVVAAMMLAFLQKKESLDWVFEKDSH